MKNRQNPGATGIGPSKGWGAWRAARDKAIAKPRKNKAAIKLNKSRDSSALKDSK